MLIAGKCGGHVEMNRRPFPTLRDDAGQARAQARVGIDPRQKRSELGCDAEAGLILQTTLAQHALQESPCPSEARTLFGGTKRKLTLALEDGFPPRRDPDVDDPRGRNQLFVPALFQKAGGLQLDFQFSRISHGRVRSLERPEGRCGRTPGRQHRKRKRRSEEPSWRHRAPESTVCRHGWILQRCGSYLKVSAETPRCRPALRHLPEQQRRGGRVRGQKATYERRRRSQYGRAAGTDGFAYRKYPKSRPRNSRKCAG